jgi:hypothetical protein
MMGSGPRPVSASANTGGGVDVGVLCQRAGLTRRDAVIHSDELPPELLALDPSPVSY